MLPLLLLMAAPPPVHWHVKNAPTKPVRSGTPFTLTITGTIDPGWHLYGLQEPDGGPIATEVSLTEGDPADLLKVDQSKPKTLNDPLFSAPTSFFEGSAEFTLHLRANPGTAAGSHPLHVMVRYQSCNDHVCLPPHTDVVEVPLQTVK